MRNATKPTTNDIDAQIAALLATRASVKLAARQNYRNHTRGPLLSAFQTLLSAGLNRRVAGAAIRAIEPTIAAVNVKPDIVAQALPAPVSRQRGGGNREPEAQREARINNTATFWNGKEWTFVASDKLYTTIGNTKKSPSAGRDRFAIIDSNPGITVEAFKNTLNDYVAKGHAGMAYSNDIGYNLANGMLRIERD